MPRSAAREFLAHPDREGERVELAMFLRGRDHYYVLRPTPYHALDGSYAGLIVTLQDVTHLRDQEARREHLVATLSQELGTPLDSQHMALDLLDRHHVPLAEEERKEIFHALVDAQDHRLSVADSRKVIAQKFGVSERQLRQIEREGLDKEWPPL